MHYNPIVMKEYPCPLVYRLARTASLHELDPKGVPETSIGPAEQRCLTICARRPRIRGATPAMRPTIFADKITACEELPIKP